VKTYDPVAADKMKAIFPDIEYCSSAYAAARGAHGLVLVTEWDEFKRLNLKKIKSNMQTPIFVDGRNIFDPLTMSELGFMYSSVGRVPARK
jgi:UDPglucose 6-dehydrogenase